MPYFLTFFFGGGKCTDANLTGGTNAVGRACVEASVKELFHRNPVALVVNVATPGTSAHEALQVAHPGQDASGRTDEQKPHRQDQ